MSSVPGSGFMSGLNGLLSGPQDAGLMGAAMGLLQSSGASRLPVTMGAALGNALSSSQAYQQQAQAVQQAKLQNAMAQIMLGYKGWLLGQMASPQTGSQPSSGNLQVPSQTSQTPIGLNLSKAQNGTAPGGSQASPSNTQVTPPGPLPATKTANVPMSASSGQSSSASGGLFPNMNPSERLTMLSGLFTDPSRLASTMYANSPVVKAKESALAIDQQMMAAAAQNNDANSYQLWQQKAYEDAGAMQHTFGGVANVLGMGPGGSLVFGKPPEATIMRNGQVQLAPGSLNAITSTEAAHKIVPVVNPVTGKTTGYTSTYSVMNPARWGNYSRSAQPAAGTIVTPLNQGIPALSIGPAQAAAQKTIGTEATQQLTEAITQQASSQQQIAQLGELTANLDALNTSAAKPAKLKIEQIVNGIGTTLGMKPFNLDLTNTQAAQKTIVNFTQTATRALGGREPFQAIQFVEQSLPNIKNTPDANLVVSGMLRGLAEYSNARGMAAQDWQSKYGSGYVPGKGTFQGAWQKTASPLAFMMDSFPEFEQRAIIKAAAKNSTLRYELQTAAKSKAALEAQGYWPSENTQQ